MATADLLIAMPKELNLFYQLKSNVAINKGVQLENGSVFAIKLCIEE